MATQQSSPVVSYTPATRHLIYAVRNNLPNMVKKSIREGGNVNVTLPNGDHLLHIALSGEVGAILCNHGAKVDALNAQGLTPLHTSMQRGIIPLSLTLIAYDADVNAQEPDGTAPLHLAESTDVNAALLLKKANPNIQDNVGDTPLLVAIRAKGSPIIDQLMNAGADKYIRNNAGYNAFDEYLALVQRREQELTKIGLAIFGPSIEPQSAALLPSFSAYKTAAKTTSFEEPPLAIALKLR